VIVMLVVYRGGPQSGRPRSTPRKGFARFRLILTQ
jgi:hypothetical protein